MYFLTFCTIFTQIHSSEIPVTQSVTKTIIVPNPCHPFSWTHLRASQESYFQTSTNAVNVERSMLRTSYISLLLFTSWYKIHNCLSAIYFLEFFLFSINRKWMTISLHWMLLPYYCGRNSEGKSFHWSLYHSCASNFFVYARLPIMRL